MANRPPVTPKQLRQLLRYDPLTGEVVWRTLGPEWFKSGQKFGDACKTWNTANGGRAITQVSSAGYLIFSFRGRRYMAHRAAWCIHHGEWPAFHIDHINGVKIDNRICNLRVVTDAENMRNMPKYRSNTSGHTGVSWHKSNKRWRAFVAVNGRDKHLGYFASKDEAAAAALMARVELGFTARHGM